MAADYQPHCRSAGVQLRVLQAAEEGLSEAGHECLDALVSSALALNLRDASSTAMLLAALAAVSAAQAVQDEEERAYNLIKELEAQSLAASGLLDGLSATLAELERASVKLGLEAEAHRHKAPEELAKVDKYRAQQEQISALLAAAGYGDEVSHGHLRALGQRQEQLAEELKAAEVQAQRYAGLPADMAAAKAAHLEKLQELEKLRERLAAGLARL